jgi:hypothetical protein
LEAVEARRLKQSEAIPKEAIASLIVPSVFDQIDQHKSFWLL